MDLRIPSTAVEYPEQDGRALAETDLHLEETIALRHMLRHRYRGSPTVYVGSNLLLYYEQDNASARFSPDVFVVIGARPGRRRIWKLWEEAVGPTVVFEVSSRGTWLEDFGNKKALCERLGVREYFVIDPEREYLDPPVQGWRAIADRYEPLAPDSAGELSSDALGVTIRLAGSQIELRDATTGQALVRPDDETLERELARAQARADRARADAEARRAEAEAHRAEAEARRAEAEARRAEAERLRADQATSSAIFTVLDARGLGVSDQVRARIAGERDEAELRALLVRAATCADASELLREDGSTRKTSGRA